MSNNTYRSPHRTAVSAGASSVMPSPLRADNIVGLAQHLADAPPASLREARHRFEREYIAAVLERCGWRMSEAARALGIERANLYRKTRQLGISRGGRAERT